MLRRQTYSLIYNWHQKNRFQYKTLNWIELDQSRLLKNFDLIKQAHSNMSIIPVLKSNAYGHGLIETASILNDADCDFLAVDGYFEAARIRYHSRHRLLVLGYILPDNIKLLDTKRCSFVVQDEETLFALASLNRKVKIHLELNTGMNRLGLNESELDSYLAALKSYPNLELEGVMSHLADADNPDNSFNGRQTELYDQLVDKILAAGFKPKYFHLAQTAGSTKTNSRHMNGVRLGIGLYGINPLTTKDKAYKLLDELCPALSLHSTIIKTIDLKPGEKVSYGGTFVAKKLTRIGVLPLGYYEAIPRELSNRGILTAGGSQLPIRGRVCMNHTMVDITGTNLQKYDTVTVISNDTKEPNSIKRLSQDLGFFSYSLLTSLAESLRREVV